MMNKFYLVGCVLLTLLCFQACKNRKTDTRELGRGRFLYEEHCASCHGIKGDGEGPVASYLNPKPRDLTSGIFKYRTTRGPLPHDLDILQIMKTGIPGSSMPGWNLLGMKDWRAILTYVKSFSPRFTTQTTGPLIEIPTQTPPVATEQSIQEGRHLYETGGCISCHGPQGKGDGPTVGSLKDAWGNPILPRDLTRGPFKWGNANKDVYRTLVLGTPGTPMPGYEQKFSPPQLWQLVHYLKSIQQMPKEYDASRPDQYFIPVARINSDIPTDFKAPEWQNIKAIPIFLKPLWNQNKGPEWLRAKAVHNDKEIVFYLNWEDDHSDTKASQSDAVAIQYPSKKISDPSELPYLGMGGAQNPVLIWEWKPSGVQEWKASGVGKLTAREPPLPRTTAQGIYEDGHWNVFFRHPLKAEGSQDIFFDKTGYLSIALWDFNLSKKNIPEAFSEWITYEIQP